MYKNFFYSFILVACLVTAALFLPGAKTKPSPVKENSTCCKKPINSCTAAPGNDTHLENLSHQFIASPILFH